VSTRAKSGVAFACPDCGAAAGLGIVRRLVLPADRRADETVLEILACACGAKALAVTETLQSPDASPAALKAKEAGRMGFRLAPAAVDLIAHLIAQCPEPAEEFCECAAHAALNRRDLRNQWNLLYSFAPFEGFALASARGAAAPPELAYGSVAWTKSGDAWTATVDGRDWRVFAAGDEPPYELVIGDAIEIELPFWPPFWRKSD
jgi:hypothetical protein